MMAARALLRRARSRGFASERALVVDETGAHEMREFASLAELLSAVADPDSTFGRVADPERAVRAPAIKAYKNAGGSELLSRKEPLPEGFHVLQARKPSFTPA